MAQEFIKQEGKRFITTEYEYVTQEAEIEPGFIYEICFQVKRTFPWQSWNWMIAQIEGYVIRKIQEIKGLEVVWWGISEEEYIIQVKKKEEKPEEVELAILTVASIVSAIVIAFAGGCLITLSYFWTKKLLPPPEEKIPWWTGLAVLGGVLVLFTKPWEKK